MINVYFYTHFGQASSMWSNYNGFVICHVYSLLETFAAVARRRTSGASSSAASTNANNSRNTANSLSSGVFGRGLSTNSVSSLVRLALSSNFPSGLLNQVYSRDITLWNVKTTFKQPYKYLMLV